MHYVRLWPAHATLITVNGADGEEAAANQETHDREAALRHWAMSVQYDPRAVFDRVCLRHACLARMPMLISVTIMSDLPAGRGDVAVDGEAVGEAPAARAAALRRPADPRPRRQRTAAQARDTAHMVLAGVRRKVCREVCMGAGQRVLLYVEADSDPPPIPYRVVSVRRSVRALQARRVALGDAEAELAWDKDDPEGAYRMNGLAWRLVSLLTSDTVPMVRRSARLCGGGSQPARPRVRHPAQEPLRCQVYVRQSRAGLCWFDWIGLAGDDACAPCVQPQRWRGTSSPRLPRPTPLWAG
jgi:hypothetical protein